MATRGLGKLKINMGCGHRRIQGYVGVDIAPGQSVDVVAPAHKVPLGDNCANELMAIHLWEHFYFWECEVVLKEWRRLLMPGGLLVLELPDLYKCCLNVVAEAQGTPTFKGDKEKEQGTLWGLFGDPRQKNQFMSHRWGWTPSSLQDFLMQNGFCDVEHKPTVFHPVGRAHRDMRIEARRLT